MLFRSEGFEIFRERARVHLRGVWAACTAACLEARLAAVSRPGLRLQRRGLSGSMFAARRVTVQVPLVFVCVFRYLSGFPCLSW